jgi:hypothetical protein
MWCLIHTKYNLELNISNHQSLVPMMDFFACAHSNGFDDDE